MLFKEQTISFTITNILLITLCRSDGPWAGINNCGSKVIFMKDLEPDDAFCFFLTNKSKFLSRHFNNTKSHFNFSSGRVMCLFQVVRQQFRLSDYVILSFTWQTERVRNREKLCRKEEGSEEITNRRREGKHWSFVSLCDPSSSLWFAFLCFFFKGAVSDLVFWNAPINCSCFLRDITGICFVSLSLWLCKQQQTSEGGGLCCFSQSETLPSCQSLSTFRFVDIQQLVDMSCVSKWNNSHVFVC